MVDNRERTTLAPPPPDGTVPSISLEHVRSKPPADRSGFENLALEVYDLSGHVADLRAIILRVESAVHAMGLQIHSLDRSVRFSAEQANETVTRATDEVLTSRQAVVDLVPRVQELERRFDSLEHVRPRVVNGETDS